MKLILASTSIYRKDLLNKLGIPFTCEKPAYNEDEAKKTALNQNKTAVELAEILSKGKAESLRQTQNSQSDFTIISGDQLVAFEGEILGKAYHFDNAFTQLKKMNAKIHELITATTIITHEKTWHLNHITRLKMKNLSDLEIKNYLLKDEPYDCAGSYKIEKSAIGLFETIDCSDHTAIQGLPLLWVSQKLKELGYDLYQSKT